jgi:SsrA-binding protein
LGSDFRGRVEALGLNSWGVCVIGLEFGGLVLSDGSGVRLRPGRSPEIARRDREGLPGGAYVSGRTLFPVEASAYNVGLVRGKDGGEPAMAKAGKDKPKGKKADEESFKIVARNRRARFEYDLMESFEAGIVLTGTEVKSLRTGKASLEEAYAQIDRDEEVWLYGCDIPEYLQANRMNHKAKRPRKLLLHRKEIDKLQAKASERGLTIVPLKVYFKDGIAKVEICVAKGRKLYDKREALKKQDAKRDIDRAARGRG